MLRNYLKTAIQLFKRNPGFTAINIIGLSTGIAACLAIVLYAKDELSYDRYNEKADRIYRITENVRLNDNEGSYAGTPKPLLNAIQQLPEIETRARIVPINSLFESPHKYFVKKGSDNIEESKVAFAESDLFSVFTLPMTEGNPSNALSEPFTAVISESIAKKYFNRTDVVGERMLINDSNVYQITGVIKDVPSQSHFHYNIFLSYASTPESKTDGWGYSGIHNYVVVKPGTNIAKLEKSILEIEKKNLPPVINEGNNYLKIELKPLTDIHLKSTSQYELEKTGDIQSVYVTLFIAGLILLIACVNFINLSTARSANRAREVGVRKVLGSARKNLVLQFLTESTLVTIIAALLAVALLLFMLPYFNKISDKQIAINSSVITWFAPSLLLLIVAIAGLAGAYPAFYLSAFKPIVVLRGKLAVGFKQSFLRNFLVVVQFSISIFLIISTIVIYKQIHFIQSKKLGFNREQVITIKNTNTLGQQAQTFKQEIKSLPNVLDATLSSYTPTGAERKITGIFPSLPIDIKDVVLTQYWSVDEDYLKTLGIELKEGRNFSSDRPTDREGMIVNEAFVKKFGLTQTADKLFYRNSGTLQTFHIIGVVNDFNYSSLKQEVKPLALIFSPDNGALTVRVNAANLPALMAGIESKWKTFSNGQHFEFSFMDDDFNAMYMAEQKSMQVFVSFSVLAIIIACLGLFGLATYAAEQRKKEIAIRKIVGAGKVRIINLLSIDFIKLVGISIIIASPIAWFAMNAWLQDFSYRISIEWSSFLLAGAIALLVALFTISFQALKAAITNPVKSLRTE